MRPQRSTRSDLIIAVMSSALFTAFMLVAVVALLQSCAPRYYPHARPKYPTSQPKWQP